MSGGPGPNGPGLLFCRTSKQHVAANHAPHLMIPTQVKTSRETPIATRWGEAFLRVESYLRAHHLENRALLDEISTDIMREARGSGNNGAEPVAAAMQVAQARISAWLARAGNQDDGSNQRLRTCDRLALALADFSGRWEHRFLSTGPVPTEFVSALALGVLQSGPELRVSHMSPMPLEFGLDDPGDSNSTKRNAWSTV